MRSVEIVRWVLGCGVSEMWGCGWGDYMRKRVMRECGEWKGRENEVSGWERELKENVLSNRIERKWWMKRGEIVKWVIQSTQTYFFLQHTPSQSISLEFHTIAFESYYIAYNLINSHSSNHTIAYYTYITWFLLGFKSFFFLKDKSSPCKLVIHFGFLSFYSEMLGTLLCIEAFLLQSYSISKHIILFQVLHFNFSLQAELHL